jgi:hypothetical protein
MTEHTPAEDASCAQSQLLLRRHPATGLSRNLGCRRRRLHHPTQTGAPGPTDRDRHHAGAGPREALHPMLWRGRQWAVTEYGIECLGGTYCIEAKRLVEDIQDWGWPAHMAEKDWVDRDEFATAWLVALALHGGGARGSLGKNLLSRIKRALAARMGKMVAPRSGGG